MRAVMAFLALGRLTSHPGLKTGLRARFSGPKIEPSWVSAKRTFGTSSGAPKPRSRIFGITSQGYRLPSTPLNTNTRPPNNGGDAFPNGTSPLYSFRDSPSRNGEQANQYRCVWDSTGVKYSPNPAPTSLAKARGCASFVGIASTTLQTDERSGERPESPRRP